MIPSQLVRALAQAAKKYKAPVPDQFLASRPEKMLHRKNAEIDLLQSEIKSLQLQLSVAQSPEVQQKLERLLFLVGDLSARASPAAHEHHARHKEINSKIKQHKEKKDKELLKIEKSIAVLEKKYKTFEKKGVDAQRLQPIRARIDQLKARVARRAPVKSVPIDTDRADMAMTQMPKHTLFYPKPVDAPQFADEEPIGVIESIIPPPPSRKKHSFLRNLY